MTDHSGPFAVRAFTPFVVALSTLAFVACHTSKSAPSAPAGSAAVNASTVAVTSCADQGAGSRGAIASLSIGVTPAPAPATLVSIYVEGETTKSITRDSTDQIHRYELPRGLYDVRVTMPGFNAVAARVTLTAGCNAELTATMRKRAVKGR